MDFIACNHGSVWILEALTPAADDWVNEHLPDDVLTWGRNGVVVERRYIDDIIDGIINDGLEIQT